MPKITFIEANGKIHEVSATSGHSLMEVARDNDVPGIDGDCGGTCMCGTCHVMFDQADFLKLGEIGPDEEQMLIPTPERLSTSRLACQITVSDDLDGLVVRLPEFQM